jgi:hypothetical protein
MTDTKNKSPYIKCACGGNKFIHQEVIKIKGERINNVLYFGEITIIKPKKTKYICLNCRGELK